MSDYFLRMLRMPVMLLGDVISQQVPWPSFCPLVYNVSWILGAECLVDESLGMGSFLALFHYGHIEYKESLQCLYNFKACCMLHYMTPFRETALDCWEECAFCSLVGMPHGRLLILFGQYYHLIEVSLFLFIFIFVRMTCQLVRVEESCYF